MFVSRSGESQCLRFTECSYKSDHSFDKRCREPVWWCYRIKITLLKAIAASSLGCAWTNVTLSFARLESSRPELVLRSSVFWKNAAWKHSSDDSWLTHVSTMPVAVMLLKDSGALWRLKMLNTLHIVSGGSQTHCLNATVATVDPTVHCVVEMFMFFYFVFVTSSQSNCFPGRQLKTTGSYHMLTELPGLNIVLITRWIKVNTHVRCWTGCRCSDCHCFFFLLPLCVSS